MTDNISYRLAASMVVCDPQGRVLLVREADPRVGGKLNLPGGHVDPWESAGDCALRELREETGLVVGLTGLIGVYTSGGGINIVYLGEAETTEACPGEDILECCWLLPEAILELPDEQILRPKKMRRIISDLRADSIHRLSVVQALEPEPWESDQVR